MGNCQIRFELVHLIVELGFISNEDEISRFNARYWLAAKAVADVLIEYENNH